MNFKDFHDAEGKPVKKKRSHTEELKKEVNERMK